MRSLSYSPDGDFLPYFTFCLQQVLRVLREDFPSLEPEMKENLWHGEHEQIPKCVCKRLQVWDLSMQVVLIFLSRSIPLTPKADVRTCHTVCTFSDVLSKESFLTALIMHHLPTTAVLGLFNRFAATQHQQWMLNVKLWVQEIHYLLMILLSVLLNFGKYVMVCLTYYCFFVWPVDAPQLCIIITEVFSGPACALVLSLELSSQSLAFKVISHHTANFFFLSRWSPRGLMADNVSVSTGNCKVGFCN